MTADPGRIATAHQLLTQLGATIADLQNHRTDRHCVPTMAEYLPQVVAAAGPVGRVTEPDFSLEAGIDPAPNRTTTLAEAAAEPRLSRGRPGAVLDESHLTGQLVGCSMR